MSSTAAKLAGLGKLQIGGEATFGTVSTQLADVQCVSVDRSGLTHAPIEDMHQKQELLEVERILGVKGGQIVTEHYLHGWSSTVPAAAPSHAMPEDAGDGFDKLFGALAAAFGDQVTGGYLASLDLDNGGGPSTTTQLKSMDADSTWAAGSFASGQAIAWERSIAGLYEVDWITDIDDTGDPNTMDTLQDMTEAPARDKVWGSYTAATKTGDPYRPGNPNLTSFSLKIFGHDSDDVLTALGCVPTGLTMTFAMGEPARMTITWGVQDWSEAGSGGAPAVQTWTFPPPEALPHGMVAWGTTKANPRPIRDLTFDLGITVQPVLDYNSANHISGWVTVDRKSTVSFSVLRDVSEEPTDYAALTGKAFTATFGSQPGKMFSLCVPKAFIADFPGFADGDGQVLAPVTLYPGYYTGDTGSGNAFDTDLRFAFV